MFQKSSIPQLTKKAPQTSTKAPQNIPLDLEETTL